MEVGGGEILQFKTEEPNLAKLEICCPWSLPSYLMVVIAIPIPH